MNDKEVINELVLRGGHGAFCIRGSSKSGQVVFVVNEHDKAKNYPVAFKGDGSCSFGGKKYQVLPVLVLHHTPGCCCCCVRTGSGVSSRAEHRPRPPPPAPRRVPGHRYDGAVAAVD